MESRVKKALDNLGVAEKDVVNRQGIGLKVLMWARLIDEVRDNLDLIIELPNSQSHFDQANRSLENLINDLEKLDVSSSGTTSLKSNFDGFARSYLPELLDLKQRIQAISTEAGNLTTLKKLMLDAKKQQQEFEKSFKSNLERRSSNSQKVLAAYFKRRLKELKTNDSTNPEQWLKKRNSWFKTLLAAILTAGIVFLVIFDAGWLKGYELQLTLIKVAIIAVVYLQYHFAAKNYHIYADLVAKYEHLAVISETMTDFTAAGFDDEELKNTVYANAAKTLFGEINTGHLKQVAQEASVIENFINQIPKGGQ